MDNSYRPNYEFYRVEIDGSAFGGLEAPQDGFIDSRPPAQRATYFENAFPEDFDVSIGQSRAYARWQQMMMFITENATPFYVGNIAQDDGSDPNIPPSMVAFTIGFDRTGSLYLENLENDPEDEPYLYGADALRRSIARSLATGQTRNMGYYDPRSAGGGISRIESGPVAEDVAAAEAAINVTMLDI